MRIGCLQFAPQVGDIDNNLNRADSVLAKANQEDLDRLDVLILPELAFTGYNFKSLQAISPYLEPSGSGISSLWARTTALKYNTNVVVGYPERVDVSPNWPTGPEYYNSAIIVNGDGETVANYRKSFLYSVDETWALESKHGFYGGYIPALGHTAMGICMDLNPYKFEAPWHAFEFAFHILEVEANLVIITMAWLTREESRHFSRMPDEPDMETLTYWIQRLEPVIRDESNEEIIVVFCNRTGIEDDAVYAGTSAVIGIKEGEVMVYGLLGRGVKELLVVDTDNAPFAKLVQREEERAHTDPHSAIPNSTGQQSPKSVKSTRSSKSKEHEHAKPQPEAKETTPKKSPREPTVKSRNKKPSPKIQIPEQRHRRTTSTSRKTPIPESPLIPTPTGPSPTPQSARPRLVIPETTQPPRGVYVDTPYPHGDGSQQERRIYGGTVSVTTEEAMPGTPYPGTESEKFFWLPSQMLLQTPLESQFSIPTLHAMAVPPTPTIPGALIRYSSSDRGSKRSGSASASKRPVSPKSEHSSSQSDRSSKSGRSARSGRSNGSRISNVSVPARPATTTGVAPSRPTRPSSPKSRNASRSGRHERHVSDHADIAVMVERLEALRRRTQSAMSIRQVHSEVTNQQRPRSPKSRNASRTGGRPSEIDQAFIDLDRALASSRASVPIGASENVVGSSIVRPPSDIFAKPGSCLEQKLAAVNATRPPSRWAQQSGLNFDSAPNAHIEPEESRTMLWSEISKIIGEVLHRPESREASRGRQRAISVHSSDSNKVQIGRPESAGDAEGNRLPQDRQGDNVRTVRYPSMGPPGDVPSDDEIVAEIIFHRNGSAQSATEGNTSRQSQNSDSSQGKKKSPSPGVNYVGKKPTLKSEKVGQPSSSPRQPMKRETGSTDSLLPTLSGSSIHTINSAKTSPTTPPLHAFEPSTPKAMVLDHKFGPTLVEQEKDVKTERPKSSIW